MIAGLSSLGVRRASKKTLRSVIGAEYENNVLSHFFTGFIDEPNLWNRALTASEIEVASEIADEIDAVVGRIGVAARVDRDIVEPGEELSFERLDPNQLARGVVLGRESVETVEVSVSPDTTCSRSKSTEPLNSPTT